MTALLRYFTPILIGLSMVLSSCTSAEESEKTTEKSRKAITETPFDRLLEGKWADLGRPNAFFEEWERFSDGLRGTGVVMSQGDTVFIEHLQIVLRDSVWYYTVKTDGDNNGEPVFFESKLIDNELGFYLFENSEHDFPQNIGYQFRESGELRIRIHGMDGDTVREETFNMWLWEGEL